MTTVEKVLLFWALSLPLLWIVLAYLKYREVKKARRIKNLENINLFLTWRSINEQFPDSPEVHSFARVESGKLPVERRVKEGYWFLVVGIWLFTNILSFFTESWWTASPL